MKNFYRSVVVGYLKNIVNAVRGVDFEKLYYQYHINTAGASAIAVNEQTAMRMTAVFSCVKLISETIGTIPLNLMVTNGTERKIAVNHPLYSLLRNKPNPDMNITQLKEAIASSMLLHGEGFIQKVITQSGKVLELCFLYPQNVTKLRQNGQIVYKYTPYSAYPLSASSKSVTLSQQEVVNIPYFTLDGINGISPITYCRESVQLGLIAEQHANLFYQNGGKPSGVIEVPQTLTDDAYNRMKNGFNDAYGGMNSFKTAVLEGGSKYQVIPISAKDAQFIETRKFQISEIARIFRVPPHMIGDLDKATFSNIEQQSIEFAKYTIAPLAAKIEAALNACLLSDTEISQGYYFKFNLDALMRGDLQSRYTAYATARQWGWMSINDIRHLEDMNPIDGGDTYLQPLNMVDTNNPNLTKGDIPSATKKPEAN